MFFFFLALNKFISPHILHFKNLSHCEIRLWLDRDNFHAYSSRLIISSMSAERTALCLDCERCNLIGSRATYIWHVVAICADLRPMLDPIPTVELKIHEWKYPSHLSWERAPGGSSDVQSPRNRHGGKRRGVQRRGTPRPMKRDEVRARARCRRAFPPFFSRRDDGVSLRLTDARRICISKNIKVDASVNDRLIYEELKNRKKYK